MKKQYTIGIIVITALILVLIGYLLWGNLSIQVTQHTISGDRIPQDFSGFRIVQISDLHNAHFGKDNCRLLQKLREASPDIIVITGDLVDSRKTNREIAISFARQAVQIAPTYYITGNHEGRISDLDALHSAYAEAGVTLLLDDTVLLTREDSTLRLTGITDGIFRRKDETAKTEAAIRENIPTDQFYTILLSHRPEYFPIYKDSNADLVLTGHAHGGQFRFPLIGGVFAPGQGLFPQYDAGTFTENGTTMIVSRGLGNSIFPFRLNNRPELVVIQLQSMANETN